MRGLGQLLLVFGLVSAALKLWLPGVHFLLLIWIDNWGNQTGWAIRIGMIVLGAVLLALASLSRLSRRTGEGVNTRAYDTEGGAR